MTSKQVRSAYRASTRGPPVSRAERLRRDRAEQDRIRKEAERERAAARARLARERRRDKELAERAHRRKLRMPLASVRPSQDTISRFARGGGGGGGGGDGKPGSCCDGGDKENEAPRRGCARAGRSDLLEEQEQEQEEEEEGASPTRVPPPPPPPSTQAILINADAFFPTSSQQARELQDDANAAPARQRSLSAAGPEPSPSRPQRAVPPQDRQPPRMADTPSSPAASAQTGNTEPARWPGADAQPCFRESQETEYGGEWVDELASELVF
ncbi:hypothetical protein UVI_02003560 [Ustilaginoidea virens]|uniref:Uncharacterized protein n=1 Tax=Ustilaginoidea virens TaxID=1159556 RepID=A0A1B5L102_USTVR|nr:hypothetical protein UVI_02003560 [Ustilaginoidea virens]